MFKPGPSRSEKSVIITGLYIHIKLREAYECVIPTVLTKLKGRTLGVGTLFECFLKINKKA